MERRSALRNMLLAMGYTVSMPTVVSLLQSCEAKPQGGWTPRFLTESEKIMVEHLCEVILPKTDIVGALEVDVPMFIDTLYQEVETEENKELFRKGAAVFAFNFQERFNNSVLNGTSEQYEELVGHFFNLPKEAQVLLRKNQAMNYKEVPLKGMERFLVYKFLLSVRRKTLMGYFTSEQVGETILAYDAIPGTYIPCGDLEAITQGKAWSLS